MVSTPEFWVLIAFLLLILVFGKKAYGLLTHVLDTYRAQVDDRLREADNLHQESLSLLKTYKTKHKKAMDQVTTILLRAKEEIATAKKANKATFETFKKEKERLFEERLALEKKEMMETLREEVIHKALEIVEKTLLQDKKTRRKLTKETLEKIETVTLGSDK